MFTNIFKHTLVYDFVLSKNMPHFKAIKTFRNCYIETFKIDEITGYFSWNYKNNKENMILTLEKNNKFLTEITYHDSYNSYNNSNSYIYSKINIYDIYDTNDYNHHKNIHKNINKDHINPLIIKTLRDKNDSHIISCGCCKRDN
jgi:hypothetical protein